MAVELKPHGVFVITLWPGAVKTEVRSTDDEEDVSLLLSACVCMCNCEAIVGVL